MILPGLEALWAQLQTMMRCRADSAPEEEEMPQSESIPESHGDMLHLSSSPPETDPAEHLSAIQPGAVVGRQTPAAAQAGSAKDSDRTTYSYREAPDLDLSPRRSLRSLQTFKASDVPPPRTDAVHEADSSTHAVDDAGKQAAAEPILNVSPRRSRRGPQPFKAEPACEPEKPTHAAADAGRQDAAAPALDVSPRRSLRGPQTFKADSVHKPKGKFGTAADAGTHDVAEPDLHASLKHGRKGPQALKAEGSRGPVQAADVEADASRQAAAVPDLDVTPRHGFRSPRNFKPPEAPAADAIATDPWIGNQWSILIANQITQSELPHKIGPRCHVSDYLTLCADIACPALASRKATCQDSNKECQPAGKLASKPHDDYHLQCGSSTWREDTPEQPLMTHQLSLCPLTPQKGRTMLTYVFFSWQASCKGQPGLPTADRRLSAY